MEVVVPLADAPSWMEGLVFSADANGVQVLVRKNSGSDYGYAVLTADEWYRIGALMGLTIPKP